MVYVREGGVRMETPGGWHSDSLAVIENRESAESVQKNAKDTVTQGYWLWWKHSSVSQGTVEHCNPAQLLIFLIMTLSYPDMVKLYVER